MAIYNEILVGRFNRALQKLLGIKGGPPAPQLASDIGAEYELETLSSVENRYLVGWERFANVTSQPAGAAQTGSVRMRNPAGSNVVAVMELIRGVQNPSANTADIYQLSQNGPNFTTDLTTPIAQTTLRLDPRGRPSPTLIASRQNAFAITGAIVGGISLQVAGFGDFVINPNQEYPLLPGEALTVTSTTVNQQTTVHWMWRERPLEEGERF
jgi:hypothetical protein